MEENVAILVALGKGGQRNVSGDGHHRRGIRGVTFRVIDEYYGGHGGSR
jgi:hypothetical protein